MFIAVTLVFSGDDTYKDPRPALLPVNGIQCVIEKNTMRVIAYQNIGFGVTESLAELELMLGEVAEIVKLSGQSGGTMQPFNWDLFWDSCSKNFSSEDMDNLTAIYNEARTHAAE